MEVCEPFRPSPIHLIQLALFYSVNSWSISLMSLKTSQSCTSKLKANGSTLSLPPFARQAWPAATLCGLLASRGILFASPGHPLVAEQAPLAEIGSLERCLSPHLVRRGLRAQQPLLQHRRARLLIDLGDDRRLHPGPHARQLLRGFLRVKQQQL